MKLTTTDISNLDKVIYGLAKSQLDTVPELIDGWEKFPNPDDPIDQTYRFYESFLVDNHVCSIKKNWIENSLFGFKYLQLDTAGNYIIHQKESILDFLKRLNEGRNNSLVNINQLVMGDNFENNSGTIINRSVVSNSLNKISQRFGKDDEQLLRNITNEVEKSGNKEALENIEEFHKEIQKAEPKKSLLKSFWNGVLTSVPTLITYADKVLSIIDKIGNLPHH